MPSSVLMSMMSYSDGCASWKLLGILADIKQDFNSVDYVKNDRYVFNIKGNQYRLIAMVHFRVRSLYVRYYWHSQ